MTFPAYVSIAPVAARTTGGTSLTSGVPSSLVSGNILISTIKLDSISVSSINVGFTGWTLGGSGTNGVQGAWAWAWKITTGPGDTGCPWGWTTSTTAISATVQLSNGGYGTPIGAARMNTGTVTSLTTNGITTTSPNSTVFALWNSPLNNTTENIDNYTTNSSTNVSTGSSMISHTDYASQSTLSANGVISGVTGTNWCSLLLIEIRTEATFVSKALSATAVRVGSPVIGSPAMTRKPGMVATAVRVGSPVIGAPALVRLPGLRVTNIRVGSPVIGSPAMTGKRSMTATAVRVGSPVVGSPALTVRRDLAATAVRVGSPVIGSPVLTVLHAMIASAVRVGSPVLGPPTLTVLRAPTVNNIRVGSPIIGAPVLSHNLVATAVRVGSPIIGAPDLAIPTGKDLTVDAIRVGSPVIGNPLLIAIHNLIASNVRVGSPIIGDPLLHDLVAHLVADNVRVGSPIFGAPQIILEHHFHVNDIRVGRPRIGSPFIGGGPDLEAIGPFFFAWSAEDEEFDPLIHAREDDDIFDFKIEQQEGDFASLSMTVRNPRIGLLAPGRSIWCWFAWASPNSGVVPLFKGRLIGLPDNIADDTVTLNFIARPSDFAAQKEAVAATMRDLPLFDPIWFSDATRGDPDNVLEARPMAWHIDRVTHVVTASNIIHGEDGTLSFGEDQAFWDSVKIGYSQNPLRSVQMSATVSWSQEGGGVYSPIKTGGLQGVSQIQSYTGEGLAAGWPKPGQSIGGGWSWLTGDAVPTGMVDSALVGEIVYPPTGLSYYADGGFDASLGKWGDDAAGGPPIGWAYHVAIPNVTVTFGSLQLQWAAQRQKTEALTFTLSADVQDILTLPDDGEVLALTMQSSEVTNAVDAGGLTPIRTPLARGYFNTDRGEQSLAYLVAVARAHLLARARAVNVSFEISFDLGIDSGVSLRKNSVLTDHRLPGGVAGGKLTSYSFGVSDGTASFALTVGAVIGKDGTQAEVEGSPDYADDIYVDSGYQSRTGAYALPFDEEDVAFESQKNVEPNDDGIDFLRNIAGHGITIGLINGNGDTETQADALGRFDIVVSNTGQVTSVNSRYAQLTVTVPDLTGGPFQTNYAPALTDLKVPRTINLEADSTP